MTVNEVVPQVVKETLTSYGIDASNPIEVQKDQQHLRKWRTRLDTAGGRLFLVALLAIVGLGTQFLGAGAVDWLKNLVA